MVDQRQRQHAAGAIAGRAVDALVEPRIGVAIGHVDHLPVARARADEPHAERYADRLEAGRDFEHELAGRRVVQPHRSAFGVQDLLRRGDDLAQHRHQVERRGERARHAEDRLEVARRQAGAGGSVRSCGGNVAEAARAIALPHRSTREPANAPTWHSPGSRETHAQSPARPRCDRHGIDATRRWRRSEERRPNVGAVSPTVASFKPGSSWSTVYSPGSNRLTSRATCPSTICAIRSTLRW